MPSGSLVTAPPSSPAVPPAIAVVVVEDDATVRAMLCAWIRCVPDFVCPADFGDAETALEGLPPLRPDVALVDINLPGLSGIECVRRLKPRMPATQFVMLTIYEDTNFIFDALAAGATGYLLKRTPRDALVTALREVHAGGSPMSSNIARKVVQSLQPPQPPFPRANPAESLSPRENEVLSLLAQGHMYKEIADEIGIGMPTVNTYIRRIYEKLHVHSRAQAVAVFTDRPTGGRP